MTVTAWASGPARAGGSCGNCHRRMFCDSSVAFLDGDPGRSRGPRRARRPGGGDRDFDSVAREDHSSTVMSTMIMIQSVTTRGACDS